jgi:predicted Zn-ribbon and HTH transcriptional regulator
MNAKTILRCLVLFILLGALLTPQAAAAQENSFAFAEDEASFSWQDVKDGKAKIEVLNNDVSDLTVDFFISGIDFLKIESTGSELTLPANESLEITLSALDGSNPEPKTYTGYLNASFKDSKTTLHLPLTITVTDETKTTPTPISDAWQVNYTMPVIFWNKNLEGQYKNRYIPIETAPDQSCDESLISLTPNTTLGTLVLTGKDTAEVTWSGNVRDSDDGSCALELIFEGLDKPGEYSGTIDLLPEDEENGDVTLTAISTHNITNPIIVIIISVILSSLALHGLNINKPILNLLLKETDEKYTINKPDSKDKDDKYLKKYKNYYIVDFEEIKEGIREKAKKLRKKHRFEFKQSLDEKNEDYQSIVSIFSDLDTKVEAWNKDFPNDIENLEKTIKKIDDLLQNSNQKPAFLEDVSQLVESKKDKEGKLFFRKPSNVKSSFVFQHERIKKANTICQLWIIWEEEYQGLQEVFGNINKEDIQNGSFLKPLFFKAKFELSKVQTLLWKTKNFEHFDSLGIDETLLTIEKLLAGLTGFEAEKREVEALVTGIAFPWFYDYPENLPEKREDRRKTLKRILRRNNIMMFVIAAFGGVLAGLQAKYFSQPTFGTFTDYLNVFTWGLGTEVAIEGIWAAISRLVVTPKK